MHCTSVFMPMSSRDILLTKTSAFVKYYICIYILCLIILGLNNMDPDRVANLREFGTFASYGILFILFYLSMTDIIIIIL